MALGFPTSCSWSSSKEKNVSFLLPPYRSKLHYDLSFTFLHPALNKLLNLPPPIFIVNDDRKVICLRYTPCRYYCTSVDPIHLKISILPSFASFLMHLTIHVW